MLEGLGELDEPAAAVEHSERIGGRYRRSTRHVRWISDRLTANVRDDWNAMLRYACHNQERTDCRRSDVARYPILCREPHRRVSSRRCPLEGDVLLNVRRAESGQSSFVAWTNLASHRPNTAVRIIVAPTGCSADITRYVGLSALARFPTTICERTASSVARLESRLRAVRRSTDSLGSSASSTRSRSNSASQRIWTRVARRLTRRWPPSVANSKPSTLARATSSMLLRAVSRARRS